VLKNIQDRRCVVLELVLHFEARPKNRILAPLRDSFGRALPVLFMWEPPPQGDTRRIVLKNPCAYITKQSQRASVI